MSYSKATAALKDIGNFINAKTNPVDLDFAQALLNLTEAIEQDFRGLRSEISALHQKLESLERR